MKIKKILSFVVLFIIALSFISGCTSTTVTTQTKENDQNVITGTITSGGSTSVELTAIAVMEEFKALNPGVDFSYDSTGSSTGVKNATDGTYSIGYASRDLKDSEKAEGLKYGPVALDGIAIVVNPANSVEDVSMEDLTKIYKGEITNWSEVGGKDAAIVVVSREQGSGTRGAFEEILGFENSLVESAIIRDGNGNVATYVISEENAIGYVSFTTKMANEDKLKGVKVNGVDSVVENVIDGSYKVSRPFLMIYREENLNSAEKAFIEFILSEEGQNVVETTGVIKAKQ